MTNSTDGTVSRIDADSGRVTKTFPRSSGPPAFAVGFGRVWIVSPPVREDGRTRPRSGPMSTRSASVSILPRRSRSRGGLGHEPRRRHRVEDRAPHGSRHRNDRCRPIADSASLRAPMRCGSRTRGMGRYPASIRRPSPSYSRCRSGTPRGTSCGHLEGPTSPSARAEPSTEAET